MDIISSTYDSWDEPLEKPVGRSTCLVEWPHPGRDPSARAANGLRGGPMRDERNGADSKAMRSLAGTLW